MAPWALVGNLVDVYSPWKRDVSLHSFSATCPFTLISGGWGNRKRTHLQDIFYTCQTFYLMKLRQQINFQCYVSPSIDNWMCLSLDLHMAHVSNIDRAMCWKCLPSIYQYAFHIIYPKKNMPSISFCESNTSQLQRHGKRWSKTFLILKNVSQKCFPFVVR